MDILFKEKYRGWALSVCGTGFILGIIISIFQSPNLINKIHLIPAILVVILGAPLTIVLNSMEFILMARTLNKKVSFLDAVRTSILSSAANMLPLPGGVLTRIAGLKGTGVSYGQAAGINFLFAFVWLAMSLLATGAGILIFAQKPYAWTFLLTGGTLLILSTVYLLFQGGGYSIVCLSILQRITLIAVDIFRVWGCLIALGIDAKLSQATVFALGGVLGAAISIVPAGLGVREGISAGLAPLVGLDAAVGFLAAALNRLLGLLFLAPTTFLLIRQSKKGIHRK